MSRPLVKRSRLRLGLTSPAPVVASFGGRKKRGPKGKVIRWDEVKGSGGRRWPLNHGRPVQPQTLRSTPVLFVLLVGVTPWVISAPEKNFWAGCSVCGKWENKDRIRGGNEQEAGRWYGRAAGESERLRACERERAPATSAVPSSPPIHGVGESPPCRASHPIYDSWHLAVLHSTVHKTTWVRRNGTGDGGGGGGGGGCWRLVTWNSWLYNFTWRSCLNTNFHSGRSACIIWVSFRLWFCQYS